VDRRTLRKILTRLRSMQKTLDSLVEQMTLELEESKPARKGRVPKKADHTIDEQALLKEWKTLQDRLLKSRNPEKVARDFIMSKTKPYLRQLFRTNSLPIDSRASKEEQLRQLLQLIRVNKTIQSGRPQ